MTKLLSLFVLAFACSSATANDLDVKLSAEQELDYEQMTADQRETVFGVEMDVFRAYEASGRRLSDEERALIGAVINEQVSVFGFSRDAAGAIAKDLPRLNAYSLPAGASVSINGHRQTPLTDNTYLLPIGTVRVSFRSSSGAVCEFEPFQTQAGKDYEKSCSFDGGQP